MADWTVVRNDLTTVALTTPDTHCIYPWGPGLGILNPLGGPPTSLYHPGNIREIRLNPLPATGTYTYTLTREDATTVLVRTADTEGFSVYGDTYVTVSRPIAGSTSRYILLLIRWDLVRNIIRTP